MVYAEVFIRGVLVERFVCIGAFTRDVYKEIFVCIELIPSDGFIWILCNIATEIRTYAGFFAFVWTRFSIFAKVNSCNGFIWILCNIATPLTDATNLLPNTA